MVKEGALSFLFLSNHAKVDDVGGDEGQFGKERKLSEAGKAT